jgi:hypothetical protein
MAERNIDLRWALWGARPPYFLSVQERIIREELDREEWIARVQKRLGLVTRGNVDQLLTVRLERLYG